MWTYSPDNKRVQIHMSCDVYKNQQPVARAMTTAVRCLVLKRLERPPSFNCKMEIDTEEVMRHLDILGYTDVEPSLLNEFVEGI